MVTITKNRRNSNWVSGKTSDGFTFEAKVFEEPSVYGMSTPEYEEGNNVSILAVRDVNGDEVYYFDRGHEEQNEERFSFEELAEIVMFLETTFTK